MLLTLALPSSLLAELKVDEPWIKYLPPSVPVRAGYMSLFNPHQRAMAIVGIDSAAFARIEIHRTIEQDGLMRMEPVEVLTLAPESGIRLEPGGLHLMMMQPLQPIRLGERIEVILRFDDGSIQGLRMTVKK